MLFFWGGCLFVSRVISFIYDIRVGGGGVSRCLTRPLILSLCGVVRERLLPCHNVTANYLIMCIQPLSRCSLTEIQYFLESVVFSLFLHLFFTMRSFFLSLIHWPFRTRLLADLIRAAILYFSCRLHLFTSRCFMEAGLVRD